MEQPPAPDDREAQRVFARVARSMLGMAAALPTVGRFELHERLGVGGMGEVYAARDPQEDREVALKLVRRDRGGDPAAVHRMKREARALTRLRHPGVVQIYEVAAAGEQVYIAMERLQGETLADRLRRDKALDAAQTFTVLCAVGQALQQAHDLGIIHRDLKPSNVFLTDSEPSTVKILDFGLAKILSGGTLDVSTASGTVMGTLHYMSPEQGRDSTKVDHRCDLWALAIIAYECLVGRRPYEADNLPELAVKVLTTAPPVPSEHGSVPPGFDAWFARATHRSPGQRFPRADELIDGLADALGQPRPERSARAGPHRGRRRAAILGAAVLACGVGGVLLYAGADPALTPRTQESAAPRAEAVASPEPTPQAEPRSPVDLPPASATLPPEPARSIQVRIQGAPAGATVWRGDDRLGDASEPIALPLDTEPYQLRVEAPGHHPRELSVVPDRDQDLSVELRRRTKNRPSEPSQKVDDLEF